jgi:K(+)-stimulated pyrophosphate-energized sodium pump
MRTWMATATSLGCRIRKTSSFILTLMMLISASAFAQSSEGAGGEASLKLPDLSQVNFIFGMDGHKLLMIGLLFCLFGLGFGLVIFTKLKNLPVHRAMLEISELIY